MGKSLGSLRKKDDITYTLRRGGVTRSPQFRIHVTPSKGSVTRLGVIVGKGVSKKSVIRNRIRRRVREAFRRVLPDITQEVDVVMLPTIKVLDAKFKDIVKEIKKAWKLS